MHNKGVFQQTPAALYRNPSHGNSQNGDQQQRSGVQPKEVQRTKELGAPLTCQGCTIQQGSTVSVDVSCSIFI